MQFYIGYNFANSERIWTLFVPKCRGGGEVPDEIEFRGVRSKGT